MSVLYYAAALAYEAAFNTGMLQPEEAGERTPSPDIGRSASYLEGHLASCSEGHFLRSLFGRTLFEAYVWQDTLHYV